MKITVRATVGLAVDLGAGVAVRKTEVKAVAVNQKNSWGVDCFYTLRLCTCNTAIGYKAHIPLD